MDWLTELALSLNHFLVFTLVLVRVSGLMLVGAPLGSPEAPMQVRALLAFAMALLMTPAQLTTPAVWPASLLGYMAVAGGELLLGLTLGLGVVMLFSSVQLAGQIVSQMSGMTLGDVFNPGFDDNIPLFSQLFYMVALAIFLILGGHRLVVAGLLDTFVALPLGSCSPLGGGLPESLGEMIVTLLVQSFSLGFRTAAPATLALLLASLVMGVLSRTLPQLNVMAFGFGLNALTTFAILSVSLGGMAWLFQDEIEPAVQTVVSALTG
jgi:flagellar biosynthetic protein FliR